ncbi:MAG: tetratricopeptide repeat protein [Candidatus Scalindua sp.]
MRKNYSITLFLIILIISVSPAYGEETEGGKGNDLYEELARQAEKINAVENPDAVISMLEPYKNDPENKNSPFFSNLALAYKVKKNYDESIIYFKIAMELEPLNPAINHNYGTTLYRVGRPVEALKYLFKSKELGSDNKRTDEWIEGISKQLGLPVKEK